MTISDIETARRVLARAKRIKRRRTRRRIDSLIKQRVYVIITIAVISIMFNIALIYKNKQQIKFNENNTEIMGELINKMSHDKQLEINEQLLHVIDSLQVMIFAYNLQYQAQLKTIQSLTHTPPHKKRIQPQDIIIENDTINEDSLILTVDF